MGRSGRRRASSCAVRMPTGPAPTMTTGAGSTCMSPAASGFRLWAVDAKSVFQKNAPIRRAANATHGRHYPSGGPTVDPAGRTIASRLACASATAVPGARRSAYLDESVIKSGGFGQRSAPVPARNRPLLVQCSVMGHQKRVRPEMELAQQLGNSDHLARDFHDLQVAIHRLLAQRAIGFLFAQLRA